jgi:hypothetical protein
MRVVIQCAARKDASAGSLRMADAREVLFVAHPRLAPADPNRHYYLPLFGTLTASLRARKVVFFNSRTQPDLPQGFELVRYRTTTRTNWHYECARDQAAGTLQASLA